MGLFFVSRHVGRRRPLLAERTLRYSCMHVLAVMYDWTDIMLPVYLCWVRACIARCECEVARGRGMMDALAVSVS